MKLRIMSFNLRVNVSSDGDNAWPYRKEQAADIIKQHKPVIVGTQEGRYDMLEDLDVLLPGYSRIGEGRAGHRSGDVSLDECCAIYYKTDQLILLENGQFWLSETPEEPSGRAWDADYPRFCTWAKLSLIDSPDEQVYLFNTHFDHVGQQAREHSAELILRQINKILGNESLPFVVTGDLNCNPSDPAIQVLVKELLDAYSTSEEPVGLTFHDFVGGTEGEPIDYIFASTNTIIQNVKVLRDSRNNRYPSDHYPILAEISFRPAISES
ncbi:endonuclease/exonuclease/phosphatase family protein [Paenibacillus sp. strain BS8-2]